MNAGSTRQLSPAGIAAALLAAALLTGCAAPGRTRVASIDIYANTPRYVTIRNASVPVQSLGRKLRSLGVNKHTRIMLNVSENADHNTGPLLMERLVHLGYPKVVIARKQPPQAVIKKPAGQVKRRK